MNPLRCASSHLTTQLLLSRNPQGAEENWIDAPDRGDRLPFYHPRIITTQIGASLLCVTALIECIAYMALVIGSIPLLIGSQRQPYDASMSLLSSSYFTIIWNFGNLTSFNLFYQNLFTQESFARYSLDHTDRGQYLKVAVAVFDLSMILLSAIAQRPIYRPLGDRLFEEPFLRPQDRLFIAEWSNQHQRQVTFAPPPQAVNLFGGQLATAIDEVNEQIEEGAKFFKEFFLDAGQIDDATRTQVIDCDPDIYIFVLTRSIYIYVFGARRKDSAPPFFKVETRKAIDDLRQAFTHDKGKDLEPLMQSLTAFNQELKDDQKELKFLFNRLRQAAYGELQNSLFVTKSLSQY